MKSPLSFHNWRSPLALTIGLHILLLTVATLPGDSHFFPYLKVYREYVEVKQPTLAPSNSTVLQKPYEQPSQASKDLQNQRTPSIFLPYSLTTNKTSHHIMKARVFSPEVTHPPVKKLFSIDKNPLHALSQKTGVKKLSSPVFSVNTIPEKPAKDMRKGLQENKDRYILGDIYNDTTPAITSKRELLTTELEFMRRVREDLLDGIFNMRFSEFIVSAEYFQLSKALIENGLQPSFSLKDALKKYEGRLAKVRKNLPSDLDAYSLIMILQRYAENKFYPENGSGLLLESLFHNLNDCEGGTKEILAYLSDIYPSIQLGSNRGMIRTTNGKVIGHMQVYLGPGTETDSIIENQNGITIETTRITSGSILPYSTGDRFPIEDFIYRYYPASILGTPFAKILIPADRPHLRQGQQSEIVGTSNHPLKMGYKVSSTLLTAQYYDLENIRTQKILNEFVRSEIPLCDPKVNPLQVDPSNVFSNFVAIDPKLRKNMMGHYLASLQYWDNEVMPQWQEPPFIIT